MNLAGVARGRLRLLRRAFIRAPGSRRRHAPAALALTLLLGAFMLWGMLLLFGWLSDLGVGPVSAAVVLGHVFGTTTLVLLVFDLHEAVVMLVADSDLELLRRAPLPTRVVLPLKLIDALPRTGMPVLMLALPAACAWAATYGTPLGVWLLLPLALLALWVVPLGFGVGLAIDLLRVVPARRARELLALLSTLALTLMWLANAFLLPRLEEPAGDLARWLSEGLARPDAWLGFSPPHRAAEALGALAASRPVEFSAAAAFVALASVLALGFAAWRADAGLEIVQTRIASPVPRRRRSATRLPGGGGVIAAVVVRDARLFVRDWTVLGDVLTAAVLWTLLPMVVAPLGDLAVATVARAMLLALTVGLGYEIASRALPFERGGMAWMTLAPVSPLRWVAAKLAAVSALSLPLLSVAVAAMALALPLGAREWVETLCLVLPALGLAEVLGLLTGATFGDPNWTHPRATLTLPGRLVASLGLLAQAGLWLVLSELMRRGAGSLPPGTSWIGPALLAIVVAALPLRALVQKVGRLEWVA